MTRRHLTFACEGAALVGTLDAATGDAGLLIVSGGNEIRSGAWSGQAQLAARLAALGHPVFRYDRRGVGDSEGDNTGYRGAAPDMAAALAAFRVEMPHLRRVVAFGNCDGASALALHGTALAFGALVLANPWTVDDDDAADKFPASAIRSRYLEKLKNPKEWIRLLSGGVNFSKLVGGLRRAAQTTAPASTLANEMHAGLGGYAGRVSILLAENDRTAQMFVEAWPRADDRIRRIASRSHSFSDVAGRDWLLQNLLEVLND